MFINLFMVIYNALKAKVNGESHVLFKKNNQTFNINQKELFKLVDEFALSLLRYGIKKGDLVGIMLENSPEWIIIDLACLKIGAIVVPINPKLTNEDINHIIKETNIKILFSCKKIPCVKTIIIDKNEPVEQLLKSLKLRKSEKQKNYRGSKTGEEDIATICYTSGS